MSSDCLLKHSSWVSAMILSSLTNTRVKYLNEVLVFINLYLDFDYTLDFSKITEEDKNKLNLGFIESYTDGSLDLLKEFFSSMLSEPVKEHQI